MHLSMAYRGIESEEFVPNLEGLGFDVSAFANAGAQLVGTYLNTQGQVLTAEQAAKVARANAQAAQADAAARVESAKRLLIAGVVVGGAVLLAAVIIAATRKS